MKKAIYNAVFTIVLCGASAVTVTFAKSRWGAMYEAHKAGAKIGAVVEAFGLVEDAAGNPSAARALYDEHITAITKKGLTTYKAEKEKGGEVIGYAIEVAGRGLEGPIHGMLALEPDKRTVIGFRIHHQEETPGLGAKIATREFLDRFKGKRIVGPNEEPGIRLVKRASAPNEVDAITGATMTSTALQRLLKNSITQFISGRKVVPLELELPEPAYAGAPSAAPPGSTAEPLTGERRLPFMVPEGTRKLSIGKPVTASDEEPIIGELDMITDGDKKGTEGGYVELGFDLQYVQIDLGEAYEIYAVVVWHYHGEPQIFHDVVVQVADDPEFKVNVRTLFNNDQDNSSGLGKGPDREYFETFEGKLVGAKDIKARYVRLYSNGNTSDEMNRYTEVQIHGRPVEEDGE